MRIAKFNVGLLTFSPSPRHRSSVAKAGAPVSPQSSPPSPLALLRARGLLLLPDSGGVFNLLVTSVAMGKASLSTVRFQFFETFCRCRRFRYRGKGIRKLENQIFTHA